MAREENDFYPTPQLLADAISKRVTEMVPVETVGTVIEPSAGAGAFVRPLRMLWQLHGLIAIDIEPDIPALEAAGADEIYKCDWIEWLKQKTPDHPVLVIGNPPFSLAEEHVRGCLDYLAPHSHVAFLLKMNFFGGTGRALGFWKVGQLKWVVPIAGRPSFVKGKKAMNDTNEYGVFIWEVGYIGKPYVEFPHIFWKAQRQTREVKKK